MEEEPRAAGHEDFSQVVAKYGDDPPVAQRKLRDLRDADPAVFVSQAVRHLGNGASGPAETHLSLILASEPACVELLTDPGRLADAEAVAAAAIIARGDPEFHRKLLAMRGSIDERRIRRILQIVSRDDRAMALVPWLRDLADGANPRLASKAAMILCRLTRNPMVVEKFLRSDDARVRANAVEGLWGAAQLSQARALLREAANDSHHRVVANALVELYRCGEVIALRSIEQLSGHPNRLFREAMVWAIGEIGSPELLPILEPLERDPVLSVRLRAGRTAKRLRTAASSEQSVPAAVSDAKAGADDSAPAAEA